MSCEDMCVLLLVFASRTTQLKNSKITFQCHGLVLFFILEIILNLTLIIIMVTFPLRLRDTVEGVVLSVDFTIRR